MRMITANQLRKLNTIVSKHGLNQETKQAMISGFTSGRTCSSRELHFDEAALIIRHIEQHNVHYAAIQKMRGKILYYAHEMGWRKPGRGGKPVADGKAVDEWMLKYSYLHKKLDAYTYDELPKLVSQFEAVYKHFLNKF